MKNKKRITREDFIKAVKIADREMGLDNGFKSVRKVHISVKSYRRNKKHKEVFAF